MTEPAIRVLFSFRTPDEQANPYVHLLTRALNSDFNLAYFSWPRALLGRYEVFHVHWPETILRGRNPLRRTVAQLLTALLLLRLTLAGTRVVRTLHNVSPHERGSRIERFLLRRLDAMTAGWILMNVDDTVSQLEFREAQVWRAPHGHFREWYAPQRDSSIRPAEGHLLLFGQLRPYKGIEPLINAFEQLPAGSPLELMIAGSASDVDLRTMLLRADASNDRLTLRLGFVPDAELVRLISACELVVLPYSKMLNSGAVLAALSLDRPVLVPRSAANQDLADEVGHGWVLMYDEPLSSAAIIDAVGRLRSHPPAHVRPRLDQRDWTFTARTHADAYRGQAGSPFGDDQVVA